MNIYVYCAALDCPLPLPELKGIAGSAVKKLVYADICLLFTEIPPGLQLTKELLAKLGGQNLQKKSLPVLQHQQLLEQVMQHTAVMPFQFLSLMAGTEAGTGWLVEHYNTVKQTLLRLKGCIEFGLKILVPAPASTAEPVTELAEMAMPAALAGPENSAAKLFLKKRYLKFYARQKQQVFCEETSRQIAKALEPVTRELNIVPGQKNSLLLQANCLVPEEKAEDFKETARALVQQVSGCKFMLSGPWPAWSFTGANSARQ